MDLRANGRVQCDDLGSGREKTLLCRISTKTAVLNVERLNFGPLEVRVARLRGMMRDSEKVNSQRKRERLEMMTYPILLVLVRILRIVLRRHLVVRMLRLGQRLSFGLRRFCGDWRHGEL